MKNIIRHKAWFLSIASILMVASIVAVAVFGLRAGIDFTGGTSWQIRASDGGNTVAEEQIAEVLRAEQAENPLVYKELSSNTFVIKLKTVSEEEHQQYTKALKERFDDVEELRFESIGSTIGEQLRSRAFVVGILVLLAISLYIAFSFRKVSRPVASWKYGIITLITLFHDAMIPIGVLAVLGQLQGTEIDTNFVVALLVIVGFSVHDTIVVFDRVRENLLTQKGKKDFSEIVNESVIQTIARSINTSLTLVLILIAMFIFGAPTLKLFVLIILIGTVVGTYSSIFVASPLLTIFNKHSNNKINN